MARFVSVSAPALAVLVSLLLACGATTSSTDGTEDTTGGGATEPPRAWLEGIREGDVLAYEVSRRDTDTVEVELTVVRLARSSDQTSACLAPRTNVQAAAPGSLGSAHWLVGDATGLSRADAASCDGELGAMVDQGAWRLPSDWSAVREHETQVGPWRVDELDLRVEGPIRGDRCARLVSDESQEVTRIVVCANVGMAELERLADGGIPVERWRLVSITSPVQRLSP